jgi:hypothetical protein
MTNDPQRPQKRGLLAALAAMTPLDEDSPEIEDLPAKPVDLGEWSVEDVAVKPD